MFNKRLLSIDIGKNNTKLVVGKQVGNNVSIEKVVTLPTPEGSYTDGNLIDSESMQGLIYNTLETEKIKVKKAVCTVNSTSLITREIILPYTKDNDEIDNMIRLELEQYLPIMLNDYVIEYKILEEFKENNVKKSKFLVVALPKSIIEKYLDMIRGLKLTPIALDINSNAVSKLFTYKDKINNENNSCDKTVAIIDIGYEQLSLNIISKGISRFFRIINYGGKDIDINIANHFNLSLQEAEERKKESCDLTKGIILTKSSEILNEIVKNNIDEWIREIEKLFKYYTTRSSGNRIDHIYVYGGNSKIKGISEHITNRLNIPTDKIESISSIRTNSKLENVELAFYLNAIGSIIRI